MLGTTNLKNTSLGLVLSPPRIRRAHLRKYSWLPDVLRIKGSIISHIIGPVLTVTLWAAAVVYLGSRGYKVLFPNSVLPLLSVVVALIMVFRNGTSYDRYWEGRKSFASLSTHIRNLTRSLWITVALPPSLDQPTTSHFNFSLKGKTSSIELTLIQLRRRKIDAIKLALAFSYATKHYLRAEDGMAWDDYADVLPPSLARLEGPDPHDRGRPQTPVSYAATRENASRRSSPDTTTGTPKRRSSPDATKRIRPKRSSPIPVQGQNTPLLRSGGHHTLDMSGLACETPTLPLPLLIAHELSRAIFKFRREGLLETVGPAGANAMTQLVNGMVEQLANMERIANTPIPSSYGIHLKQCVTLYLFALPFTLTSDLGWATVPIVTVVAFTFMGIEGIADQIEMPFGTDRADLPLDRYCNDLKEEVQYLIERLPEGGEGIRGYDDGEGDD